MRSVFNLGIELGAFCLTKMHASGNEPPSKNSSDSISFYGKINESLSTPSRRDGTNSTGPRAEEECSIEGFDVCARFLIFFFVVS